MNRGRELTSKDLKAGGKMNKLTTTKDVSLFYDHETKRFVTVYKILIRQEFRPPFLKEYKMSKIYFKRYPLAIGAYRAACSIIESEIRFLNYERHKEANV